MRIVTRDHLEAFILLLQDEFRGQRSESSSGRDGVSLVCGRDSRGRQSIHTCCSDRTAHENGQLARDAAEELLLIVLHAHSLNPQNPDSTDFISELNPQRDIIFPRFALREHWKVRRCQSIIRD